MIWGCLGPLLLCRIMDYLWTPWRYAYVAYVDKKTSCVFCDLPRLGDDAKTLIVYRAEFNYIILNAFPYTSGHVMVVPYEHVDRLNLLSDAATTEMMLLSRRLEQVLFELYEPDGMNIGMNIGRAAGAGIAGHVHLHALPRWVGDTNFMTVIGETRLLPESLDETYQRLKGKF